MAVRVLTHSPVRTADQAVTVPGVVLAVALVPSALDLLTLVQPGLVAYLSVASLVASGSTLGLLLLMWLRYPGMSWLAAGAFAACAALALRLAGADVAPVLSLLAIVALGMGGAFSRPEISAAGA